MIASLAQATSGATVSASGWTAIRTSSSGLTLRFATLWKIAAAADIGGSTTFTFSLSAPVSGGISAYRNVHTAAPIQTSSTSSTTSSTSITDTGVTTTFANELLVGDFAITGTNSTTLPVTMTGVYQVNPSGVPDVSVGYKVQAAAGASGNFVATATTAGNNNGQLIAVRPGP